MNDVVVGAVAAVFGVFLIVGRRQFATRTVRQQNRFWRKHYGEREVKHNERAAVIVGVFVLAVALLIWFG